MKIKKRFIAGACCPQCNEFDVLRWWANDTSEFVDCVLCHYKEQRVKKLLKNGNFDNKIDVLEI